MPHLGKLVRLFDFLISMEMSDQCPMNLEFKGFSIPYAIRKQLFAVLLGL